MSAAQALLNARAVRKSSGALLDLALADGLADWTVDLTRLPLTADYVAQVVRNRYPRLDPPMHSRWRHFVFEGRDLWNEIADQAKWPSTAPDASGKGAARARAEFDL